MDTSDDKDILMRIPGTHEFGCRNMVHLMLWSLCLYYLYQKRLGETAGCSEIVTPNIVLRKLK